MAKETPEVTYKAKWKDGDIYELRAFVKEKSVKGREFVKELKPQFVSLLSTIDRVRTTKIVYYGYKDVLKALKDAKPVSTRKGPK